MTWEVAFTDGFDHYAPADAGRKYRTPVGAYSLVPGPHHGSAARFAGAGNYLDRLRGGATVHLGAGVWLYLHASTWGAAAHVCPLQLLRPLADGGYAVAQHLWVHADGSASVRRGAAGAAVLAASDPGAVPFDAWTYVWYSSSLATDGTGRCDVVVDGVPVVAAGGLTTLEALPGESPTCSDVRLGNCLADGNGVHLDLDDFATLGTYNGEAEAPEPDPPTQTGPHAVATLFPAAPGDEAGFPTVVGATEHWAASAEPVADLDASYVEKAPGANPLELYRVGAFGTALPELPESWLSPEGAQYAAAVWWLLLPVGGGNGFGSTLVRYTDEAGALQTLHLRRVLTGAWPTAGYRYYRDRQIPSRRPMQTLQVGYGHLSAAEGNPMAYRGSQAAVELWYPAGAPRAPGGQRWSVGGLP